MSAASSALPAGSYTTLRTYAGNRVLRLEQHVTRLETSLDPRMELPRSRVEAALAEALASTAHPESRLRLTWAPPRLYVSVEPFTPPAPALIEAGASCVTVVLQRDNPHAKQ